MNSLLRRPRLLVASACAFATLALVQPSTLSAREHTGETTDDRGATLDRDVQRDDGTVEKTAKYTSPSGQVSTRTATRTLDKSTGTVTGSAKTTLANGKTASSNFTSVKTDTGRTTTGQITGFNGKVSNYQSTTTRTANGFKREAVTTGPNGGTVTKDVDVTHEDGTTTRTATVTANPPAKP